MEEGERPPSPASLIRDRRIDPQRTRRERESAYSLLSTRQPRPLARMLRR
jgi:hypothetical protein